LLFNADGSRLLTSGADGAARLWDAVTAEARGQPLRHGPEPVLAIAFSRDGKWFCSGSNSGNIRVWRAARSSVPGSAVRLDDPSTNLSSRQVEFGPAEHLIAVTWLQNADLNVEVWQASTGLLVGRFSMPKAAGPHAAISSDGRKLAIGYRDESDQRLFRVQLYDLATKTKLGRRRT
jgi:WD40 repeat protein